VKDRDVCGALGVKVTTNKKQEMNASQICQFTKNKLKNVGKEHKRDLLDFQSTMNEK
jgi:hypothetical protein